MVVSIGVVAILAVAGLTVVCFFSDDESGYVSTGDKYYGIQRNNNIEVYGPVLGGGATASYCNDLPNGLTATAIDYGKMRIYANGSIPNGEYVIHIQNTENGTLYSRAIHIVVNDSWNGDLWEGTDHIRSINVGQSIDWTYTEPDSNLDLNQVTVDQNISGLNATWVNYSNVRIYGTPTTAGLYVVAVDTFNAESEIEEGFRLFVIVSNPQYNHTITYNGNSATSGSVANTVVTDANGGSSNVTLANNGFYRAGYTFAGWSVNGVTYQPGTAISVGGNQTVTAYAVWSENTLTATANNGEAASNQAIGVQINAVANNGASLSYVIKSCSAGTASVSGGGLVTFKAPTVSATTTCNVVVTVTATYPDGQTKAVDCAFSVLVDPILAYQNSITDGSLTIKGAA